MLKKNQLVFVARKGRIYPQFVAAKGRDVELAEALVARLADGIGDTRGDIESELDALASSHPRPVVGRGLVKLLLDRAEFEEPDEASPVTRAAVLAQAEAVRAALPDGASFAAYEAALSETLDDLEVVRRRLFEDLPERRRLLQFASIAGARLLERYDLAQVQGLLVYADRVELRIDDDDTPSLRRLLRWMRFNRLVADVRRDEGWSLAIEGPAAVIEGAKRYGLQLATFFLAVPSLKQWELTATVAMPRRPPLQLVLTHEAGLRSGLEGGAGHVPPEIERVIERWTDPAWRLDPHPAPRPVGVEGWCVPDLAATRADRVVAIELFHPWHRGALPKRLQAMSDRPDDALLLGVDRKLASSVGLDPDDGRCFLFSGYPTERVLKKALTGWWTRHEAG